ncbi:MAG: hypothetical protein JW910_20645 [Anaerolineae bacterium]|nr:hypothetical protein [Anaerolineae bacterium]
MNRPSRKRYGGDPLWIAPVCVCSEYCRDDAVRRPDEAPPHPYKVYDAIAVNESLTLRGLPPQAFAYRLGNRSALEWIVDQYQVKTDRRSGITHDPNAYAPDDEQYIVRLIGQVVRVSVEMVRIVSNLPGFVPE